MRRLPAPGLSTLLIAALVGVAAVTALLAGVLLATSGSVDAAVLTASPAQPGDVTHGPAGRLPARPAEVEEAPDATDGLLRVEPPVISVTMEPGEAAQPTIAIVNGGEGEAGLTLEVVGVAADEHGAPVPVAPGDSEDDAADLASAVDWITLGEDVVWVGPQERALLRPSIEVPAGSPSAAHLAALRARVDEPDGGSDEVVAFIVVDVIGPDETREPAPVDLDATLSRAERRAALDLHLDSPGLAHVRGVATIRRTLLGSPVEVQLPEVLLLPGVPRVRTVTFDLPLLPGHFRADVVVETAANREADATASGWLWDPAAAVTAMVLLLAAAGLLVVVSRRRRSGGPRSGAPDAGTPEAAEPGAAEPGTDIGSDGDDGGLG